MERDQALLKNAQVDLQRYQTLFTQDSISKQQHDTQESLVRQYEGAVKTDQGQIDSAKLQLTYCRITAPIGGVVGLRQIDPGNMVRAADTKPLVVITQVRPITVMFALPQDGLAEILAQRAQGRLPVAVYSRDGARHRADGELASIDNQVDPTTGQFKLKAVFANADSSLWPGEFVSTRLLLRTERNAVVVPSRAVQSGQDGSYVYVVQRDDTVEPRNVKAGPTADGVTALRSGVKPGEIVVLDGQSRLAPGVKVDVKQAAEPGSGARS